ncbi:MAG: low specificity L-threonine aldolase [Calditrichia bacterium]|nr:low specificity L-threonine aldolase [Calditrichia bacterium]
MKTNKNFASDNNSGVHPEIMNALNKVNEGYTIAYGDDKYTEEAVTAFKNLFGQDIEVYFVFGGTAANVISLQAISNSYNAIICADEAHINVDECGAPEKFTGAKLLDLPSKEGKITVEQIVPLLGSKSAPHHSVPSAISITQATEVGTVYSPEEIKQITGFAHKNNMYVHMDGARIANAAVYFNGDILSITKNAGIDILSFGGTKNGGMYGEAVIFFNTALTKNFPYLRKQSMQLSSKMRFIAAQFSALLKNDLWLKNAGQANKMAALLAKEASKIPGIEIMYPVQANGVFAKIPHKLIKPLQDKCYFYIWNEKENIARWMTSFDTTEKDVYNFIEEIKKELL